MKKKSKMSKVKMRKIIKIRNAYVGGQNARLVLLAHQHGHILLHIHCDARLVRVADP